MNIQALLSERAHQAMTVVGAPVDYEPQVRWSVKAQFGDYQANGVMAAAKKLGMVPRQLAEQVLIHLGPNGIASKVETAGLSLINIFLDPALLTEHVQQTLTSDRLGIVTSEKQTIVVDYSASNVVEETYAGHLCSTIVGGVAARALEFPGHKVIRINHVDDWGTQSGMLIVWLEKQQQENADEMELADSEGFHHDAKKHYDKDEEFAEHVCDYVVKLQSGDEYFRETWHKLVDIITMQNQTIYNRLNVTLTRDDVTGEGFYNPTPLGTVADPRARGLAVENGGATVVFLDEFRNKEGEPIGATIQRKDGGYLYITTDTACAEYRHEALHADRVLYYTDSRRYQHLMQAWAVVRKAGYAPKSVSLEHHMSGTMLDKDDKPFKAYAGGTVKLTDLLDEVLERARRLVVGKNPDMPADKLEKPANVVGIGAMRYADLSENRTTDYISDWNNMLAFEGNTASYMQYVYTRVLPVLRKAEIDEKQLVAAPVTTRGSREAQLAVRPLQFGETFTVVAREGTPHVVCACLYDLAGLPFGLYGHCPILSTENEEICNSRLKLA